MNNKLKELELKIEELKLEIKLMQLKELALKIEELVKLKENYHTLYIIPETKPIQPKPYPEVWYPQTICTDENPTN